jgi:hypothetical protein
MKEIILKKRINNSLFNWFYGFKYPKIVLLIFFIVFAYFIFRNPVVYDFLFHLEGLSYLGVFIAGMLLAFGFTAPFAVGFFIALNPSNIFIAGILGGLGALISDFLIFKFIKTSFEDEFKRLEKTKTFKELNYLFENAAGHKIKIYLMYVFAGFLIASPLPDEAGVVMLAGLTKIKPGIFALLSIILHTTVIILILLI